MNTATWPGRENRHEFFTGLYNQSFEYVYSFVFARTAGNSELTEEIVQEAFVAAWVSLGSFSQKSSWRTWLCSIAKNKLWEHYRRELSKQKSGLTDDGSLDGHASGIELEKTVIDNETRSDVLKVLKGMPPTYRYALIMKYMDGMRVKEIAKVLGRSAKAVDGILQRARGTFEKAYSKLEGSDKK
jgi:RNA polymerase sigma-70 factor (ECF subfamily)